MLPWGPPHPHSYVYGVAYLTASRHLEPPMGIFAFIIIGLVVGLFARVVIPGNQKLGLGATCLLGMLGSLVGGGLLTSLFSRDAKPFELVPLDITLAVVFAVLFLVVVGVANSRRAHA